MLVQGNKRSMLDTRWLVIAGGLFAVGCTRDVVVGVSDLPAGEAFQLTLDGQPMQTLSLNTWSSPALSMRETHQLQLWYGERECTLSNPIVEGQLGFGEWTHKTDWSCAGLIGYEMLPVGELLVGKSEVTVGLWQQLKGEDSEDPCGAQCPKSNLNWLQALEFANQLSMVEGLDQCYTKEAQGVVTVVSGCNGYRLPTDAEWTELSSQDKSTPFADSQTVTEVGWMRDNSDLQRHPVCQLQTNGFGLCDTTGNVWEWVWDTVQRKELRRVRGGGFTSVADVARLDNVVDFPMGLGAEHVGFRLVRTVSGQ